MFFQHRVSQQVQLNMDLVLTDNIEKPSEELLKHIQSASAIVFSDVLEHLYNPWQTLKFLRSEISNECVIYASIPNIQHWSIIFGLISGNFNYTDSGLLDRTHIRFFTKSTIISMFNDCGFEVKSITVDSRPILQGPSFKIIFNELLNS